MTISGSGRPLVIVGAGGFGREVLDLVELDPSWSFLGPTAELEHLDAHYLIGIGEGAARRRIDEQATAWGRPAASIVHPSAHWGGDTEAGPGLVVCSHVSITTNIRMGRHVHVNLNVTIGHDCTIGDYVTFNPGAHISGRVSIGEGATVGTGAAVIPDVTIGAGAMVGAGAVVVRDVEPGTTVAGVPARPLQR